MQPVNAIGEFIRRCNCKIDRSRRLYSDAEKLEKRLRRGRFPGGMIYRLNFKRDSLQPSNLLPSNRPSGRINSVNLKNEKIEEEELPSPLVALYFNRQRSFL